MRGFSNVLKGDSSLFVVVQHPYLCVTVFKDWNTCRKQIFVGDSSHKWDKTGKGCQRTGIAAVTLLTSQPSPSLALTPREFVVTLGSLHLSRELPALFRCWSVSTPTNPAPQRMAFSNTEKVGCFSSLLWEAEGFLQEAVPYLLSEPRFGCFRDVRTKESK